MAEQDVQRSGHVAAPPASVWARVRDFCAPWHPLIARMWAEDGGQTRAFTVAGVDTIYRERLTWFSDSDRTMRYAHLEGIEGAQHYAGCMKVAPSDQGGSVITMCAQIEAEPSRTQEIAKGTAAIFETGLAALSRPGDEPQPAAREEPAPVEIQTEVFDDTPQLALSLTPKRDGPLCLFLHGIGGNRSNWDAQLGLAGTSTQSAALDLRGYGDSSLGPTQSTVDDYCDDILRVAERLGAQNLILCGLSYGSWIATAFAEKHPDRLAGLILSGGCTGMSEAQADKREAFLASREAPLDAGQSPADLAPAVIPAISGPNATAAALAAMQASMAAIPTATYRDALRCFTNPQRRFDFSKFSMPVLMMTGEHDKLAPPAEIKSVATRIYAASLKPDVRFEVIKGAGHICNVEAPDLYNVPLQEFLTRVAR